MTFWMWVSLWAPAVIYVTVDRLAERPEHANHPQDATDAEWAASQPQDTR